MRAITSWILASVLLTQACSKPAEEEPEAGDDIPALNSKIEIDKAEIPARYAAALPSSSADMKRWFEGDVRFPSFAHVKDHVLAGDELWIARLGEAANKVSAADQAAWVKAWTGALRFEITSPGYCAPVRKIVAAPASAQRLVLIGHYAGECATDAEVDLIMRADTPDAAVIAYYDSGWQNAFSTHKHPFHPRFESATRALILAGESEARGAALNLAEHPDPRGRAALWRIHAELKDPTRADEVALAFHESKDPADRALTVAACKRMPKDPICIRRVPSEDSRPERPPDAAELEGAKASIAKLAAAGFSKVSTVDPADSAGGDTGAVLMLAGHAWWFDVETGFFPNYHDSLMRRLASLVSPALDDAVFEETAPSMDSESEPYRLTVYTAGKRLRAEARNLGDWYDVEAVINLMNAVMKENGSDVRFVPLSSDDQTLVIVGAPQPVIDRAIQARLIQTGEAGEAERVGKEAEANFIERLQN